MVKKTVLKVHINCLKCKKQLLKAVSSLQGVDKIEVDEVKGTMTVTGDADPYEIIVRTRKAGKFAQVISIGPPPAPPPKQDAQKKPEGKKKPEEKKQADPFKLDQMYPIAHMAHIHMPHHCSLCQQAVVGNINRWDDPNPSCSIL